MKSYYQEYEPLYLHSLLNLIPPAPKLTSHVNIYSSSRNLMKWGSGILHAQGPSLTWHKLGVAVHTYNSSAQKVKERLETEVILSFMASWKLVWHIWDPVKGKKERPKEEQEQGDRKLAEMWSALRIKGKYLPSSFLSTQMVISSYYKELPIHFSTSLETQ